MTCRHLLNDTCIHAGHEGYFVCDLAVTKNFQRCANYEPYKIGSGMKEEPYSEGAYRITKERMRQITEEGMDERHDDTHIHGDLAVYAASLAIYGTDAYIEDPEGRVFRDEVDIKDEWGLIEKHKHDQVRMLEIAGALIAAELDRVLRQKK